MKLRYHILFFILLTEDIFCFKNDDSIKHTSEIPNIKKYNFYDTFVGNSYENNKNDNNLSTSILYSIFCSLKKLFYKENTIEKDIKAINDNTKNTKDEIIKDSSNISKNTDKLKENILKNSNYWLGLFKKSMNEELHEIDKQSNEQLNKLKQNPDNSLFFSKILNFVSNEKTKIEENKNINTEKNEEKKSSWFLSSNSKNLEQNEREDSGLLKEKKNLFGIFQYDDQKKNTFNNTTNKNESHWWFNKKNEESEQKKENINNKEEKSDLSNNEVRKSIFDFFSNKNKNIEEKKDVIEDDKKVNTQKRGFSFFSKNSNEEKKESDFQMDIEKEHREISLSNKTNDKENSKEKNTYWWQRKGTSSNENLKIDETGKSNINEQDKNIEEKVKKNNYFIFNLWNNDNKSSNNIETKKKTDDSYVDIISEENDEEKRKREKSSFNKYKIYDDNNSNIDNDDNEYKKLNSDKIKGDDSEAIQLNSLKKYYDTNENIDDINYLSFLNSEHKYEENVDCHPLIVFKVCLNKCFKSLSNESKEVSDKSALSVNDYKYLEKCILKCKKLSFDYVHGGCIQKDGTVLNKKQNYKDYLEEIDTYNLKLEDYPSNFSDFTIQEKYIENKNSFKRPKHVNMENKSNDTQKEKTFSLLDISKEELSTHIFDKDNSEKIKNFMKDKELNTNNNTSEKSFNFFKSFKNEKENESNDEKSKENNDNKLDLNNNDSNENIQPNDYNYLSTSFFLILLLVTFFVYLSAFTNIINQFYVSFKEKVCLFIKRHYKTTFNNGYNESSETFLPKNQNNNFHNSYENLYHSFQEKPYDIA
ncbi:conserved Plasmodium protein, unknown function [Plasmodium gallinaceum]|uniref:Uncharacterized protein n=1 Tax=Plasmodium gallinaceum TaxID=5849 RepID=A0A1J1GWL1_PLAGA|nr:conserved Plasmodium protein, unknown function [Plasmodium gallinaceum]CRG96929.1 conserved Plasmodium protein, unknown function [Plasmodium gallinaceum]